MQAIQIDTLAKMRAVVGYLGEKGQHSWWPSVFFATSSTAFLTPAFPRTRLLAQCNGVTRAAAVVHDERIGVGSVYHLFRLPEDLERALYQALHDKTLCEDITALCISKEAALDYLYVEAGSNRTSAIGPTKVGSVSDLMHDEPWRVAAAHYLHGYGSSTQVFPYFVGNP
jgi:hypothetical protein